MDEKQFKTKSYPGKKQVEAYAGERGMPCLEICGKIEMEISQLPAEDRELFMADLDISESGIDRLARAAYDYLGLISFLTVGADEVKAWTIQRSTDARRAAGKIHSDIERGFIRAEVVKYRDLEDLGSMTRVKEKGLSRLEGKDYIVETVHNQFPVQCLNNEPRSYAVFLSTVRFDWPVNSESLSYMTLEKNNWLSYSFFGYYEGFWRLSFISISL